MKSSAAQPFIATRLRASVALAGLPIMTQLPRDATPAELDAADAEFEKHLAETGVVIVVMRPEFRSAGTAASGSAVALGVCVPIAITENQIVNRAPGGSARVLDDVFDDVIAASLCDVVSYPPGEIGQVDLGDGLQVSYLQPHVRCVVRAA
jgi:hypothetical protein